jgi:hypothetical protein
LLNLTCPSPLEGFTATHSKYKTKILFKTATNKNLAPLTLEVTQIFSIINKTISIRISRITIIAVMDSLPFLMTSRQNMLNYRTKDNKGFMSSNTDENQ